MAIAPVAEMDVEYATTVADRAIQAMAQQCVPATPDNFAVWFNYALGSPPELRKSIDILIAGKRRFDATTNHQLHSTFFGTGPKDIAGVPDQFQSVISNAKQFLAEAIADNKTQMQTLGEVSSQVQAKSDPAPIIEKLVNELSSACARATTLEANFAGSSAELDKIRESLKIAEERSNTDPLTGLANRRSLDAFFRSAQILAMENDEPLSILMIDIDHFKKFNDTHGHHVGDQVLRLVAKVVQEGVREVDLAARYGGEELIAVLPGADLAVCAAVAERIRQRVSDARLTRRTSGEDVSRITISIGVAQFRLAESANDLIERCDRALYQAKRAGRNKTVIEAAETSLVA